MVSAKPDCTKQKFGYLTVIGKGKIIREKSGRSRRLWVLECFCGNRIELARGDFDRRDNGQKSCGCMKYKSPNLGIKPQQLSGKRFGNLVAIAIVPGKINQHDNSKVWLCQCDCGNRIKKSTKRLNNKDKNGLHCGVRNKIHIPYSNYPPAPIPYPEKAGAIFTKYLYLTKQECWNDLQFGDIARPRNSYNAETEDERIDRLLRASWIVTYKRSQGEYFSDLKEKNFIKKHLRYSQTDVYTRRKNEI